MADVFNGLVLWYKYEDTVTTDSSGNGYTGTLAGSPLPTLGTGRIGQGLVFVGGATSQVQVPAAPLIISSATSSFTMMGWLNTSVAPGTPCIILSARHPTNQNPGINLQTDYNAYNNSWTGAASILLRDDNNNYFICNGTSNLYDGTWHHIAAVFNGSGGAGNQTLTIYVDGVSQNSVAAALTTTITPGAPACLVGYEYWVNATTWNAAMTVDDLRVYNRALSATEISNVYNAASSISGFLTTTQANQTLSATGNVPTPITGTLSITQANQTLSASGNVAAPKTFWILNTTAPSPNYYGQLQDGGTTPTAVLSTYGWTVAKTATSTPYWRARLGASATATTAAATSYIDSTTGPTVGTGATNTTAGDAFISPTNYSGIFVAGNWTLSFGMRTAAATTVGRIRCRIWASTNANGSSARELTSGAVVGSTVTMSTTTTTYTSSATWAAPQIILNNEYLFFQVEWNETTAGTSTSCTSQFYVSAASIGTAAYTTSLIGTLAITQADQTLSATGNVPVVITGTLAVTEVLDTLSAAGRVTVGGTLGITQVAQTLSAAGTVPLPAITGTLAITQANQTLSAAGGPRVGGTLTVTQANQTLSATGSVILVGNLTATQAAQTLVAAGSLVVGGTLTITQAAQTLSAAGTVRVSGTLAVTQANQTLSAAGGVTVRGTLSVNQAAQTLSGTGSVLSGIVGSLNITQAAQTLSAAGTVPNVIGGSLNITQAAQTLSATGTVFTGITGTLALIQANNTLAATGTVPIAAITGTLALTQATQTLSATATIPVPGTEAMHTLSKGNLYVAGSIKTAAGPVSGLPHPGRPGTRNFVTDATVPFASGVGNIVTGGGSNKVPVYDDGANWRIG